MQEYECNRRRWDGEGLISHVRVGIDYGWGMKEREWRTMLQNYNLLLVFSRAFLFCCFIVNFLFCTPVWMINIINIMNSLKRKIINHQWIVVSLLHKFKSERYINFKYIKVPSFLHSSWSLSSSYPSFSQLQRKGKVVLFSQPSSIRSSSQYHEAAESWSLSTLFLLASYLLTFEEGIVLRRSLGWDVVE